MEKKCKDKELSAIIEKELRDTGYSQIMPSRIGYRKQLDRIERMLKYQIVEEILKSKDDFIERMSKNANAPWDTELIELLQKRRDKIVDLLPDISDIIEVK